MVKRLDVLVSCFPWQAHRVNRAKRLEYRCSSQQGACRGVEDELPCAAAGGRDGRQAALRVSGAATRLKQPAGHKRRGECQLRCPSHSQSLRVNQHMAG